MKRGVLIQWGAWFFIANACLGMLIGIRYFTTIPDIVQTGIEWLFVGVTLFSHILLINFLLFLLLFIPLVLITGSKILSYLWGIVLGTFGLCFLLLDTFIYAQYKFHFNGFVFNLLFGGSFTDIFSFSFAFYALSLGMIIALALTQWLIYRWATMQISSSPLIPIRLRYIFGVWFITLLTSHFMYAYYDATYSRSVVTLGRYFPFYYPLTMKKFLLRHGVIDEQQIHQIQMVRGGGG